MKINDEIRKDFAMSERAFKNKMDEIFLKLFNEGVDEIVFQDTYVINSDNKKYHIKKISLDRIKKNIVAYDEVEKKYYAINKTTFTTKYELLNKILF